jgi:hypothetical protein
MIANSRFGGARGGRGRAERALARGAGGGGWCGGSTRAHTVQNAGNRTMPSPSLQISPPTGLISPKPPRIGRFRYISTALAVRPARPPLRIWPFLRPDRLCSIWPFLGPDRLRTMKERNLRKGGVLTYEPDVAARGRPSGMRIHAAPGAPLPERPRRGDAPRRLPHGTAWTSRKQPCIFPARGATSAPSHTRGPAARATATGAQAPPRADRRPCA